MVKVSSALTRTTKVSGKIDRLRSVDLIQTPPPFPFKEFEKNIFLIACLYKIEKWRFIFK